MPNSIDTQDHYRNMQIESAAIRQMATKDQSLGMKDFITLLVAQLQNQDMMNPMDNAQFMGQMAQFSTLQAMNDLQEMSVTSYALSMIGKEIEGARIDQVTGQMIRESGVVTGVTLFEGRPIIYVGDTAFDLANIMTIGTFPKKELPNVEDPLEDPENPLVDPDRYGFALDDDGNPIPGFLIDSKTGYSLNLDTGEVSDPVSGGFVYQNPETGELNTQPDMGDVQYIFGRDQDSGWLVDPDSGWLINPETGKLLNPADEAEEEPGGAGSIDGGGESGDGGQGGDGP